MSLQVIEWQYFLEGNTPEFSYRKSTQEGSAMTIGVFDGVHLGHQALIERIVKHGPNPTVVTFRENPKKLLCGIEEPGTTGSYKGDLYSLKQKMEVFESLGVKFLVLIDFSEEFSKLEGREFLDILGNNGNMAFLAIGNDFRCGFRQDTDKDLVKQINDRKGIRTEIIPPVYVNMGPVSSSLVRSLVFAGGFKLASEYLGRNFSLDLSDVKPECNGSGYVYDLSSVCRIAPTKGEYSVLMYPGGKTDGIAGRASAKDGKIFLPMEAESLEFETD